MQIPAKPLILPNEFERRYVVGRMLEFFPVCSAILALACYVGSKWWPLFLVKYVLLLAFFGWAARRHAGRQRVQIERWDASDSDWIRESLGNDTKSHLLPLLGAVATLGAILAIARRDARWSIVVFGLGGLIAAGLLLRWIIFDRWIAQELLRLERQLGF